MLYYFKAYKFIIMYKYLTIFFIILLNTSHADYYNNIRIISDHLEINNKNALIVFTGNVSLINKDYIIKSDKSSVYFQDAKLQAENIIKVAAEGNVSMQSMDKLIMGDALNYLVTQSTIEIKGKVSYKEKQQLINCNKLTYNLKTKNIDFSSQSTLNKPVEVIINPNYNNAK